MIIHDSCKYEYEYWHSDFTIVFSYLAQSKITIKLDNFNDVSPKRKNILEERGGFLLVE